MATLKITPELEARIEKRLTQKHGTTIAEIGADLLNFTGGIELEGEMEKLIVERMTVGEPHYGKNAAGKTAMLPPDTDKAAELEGQEVRLRPAVRQARRQRIAEYAQVAYDWITAKYGKPRTNADGICIGIGGSIVVHPDQHLERILTVDINTLAVGKGA